MNFLAYILTFLLFIGPVILAVMGWPVEGDLVKKVHLYPSFYILSLFFFVAFFTNKLKKSNSRYAIVIVFVVLFWFFVSRLFGGTPSRMLLFNSMVLPAFYYLFFWGVNRDHQKNDIKKFVLFMFMLNSIMAIYERMTMNNFFPFDLIRSEMEIGNIVDTATFRSSALLGHPLTNSLIMAIVMVFVLTSNINTKKKYFYYFIGMFGLFCFNSRASIMISAGTCFMYLISPLFNPHSTQKQRIGSMAICCIALLFGVYLFSLGFGGRFEDSGRFSSDSSVLARIEVWEIFTKGSIKQFLWGMTGDDAEAIAYSLMGMVHIENWFIMSSMIGGLVLTTIIVLLYIPLFVKSLSSYSRYTTFLILLVVVGLSSTNNSLACGVPALATFFVCSYSFSPIKRDKIG